MDRQEIIKFLNSNLDSILRSNQLKSNSEKNGYIELIASIRISNYCTENCPVCPDRVSNTDLKRYRMNTEEIITTAKKITNHGLNTIIFETGKDSFFDVDIISYIIYSIKNISGARIILNLGSRTREEYHLWKIAGADAFIVRFETGENKIFSWNFVAGKLEVNLSLIEFLQKKKFVVGSGFVCGFPDQSVDKIADDLFFIQNKKFSHLTIHPYYNNFNRASKKEYLIEENLFYKILLLLKMNCPGTKIVVPFYLLENEYLRFNKLKEFGIDCIEIDYTPIEYTGTENINRNKSFAFPVIKSKKSICGKRNKFQDKLSDKSNSNFII